MSDRVLLSLFRSAIWYALCKAKLAVQSLPTALKALESHINRLDILQHIAGNIGDVVGREARVEHVNCAAKSFCHCVCDFVVATHGSEE